MSPQPGSNSESPGHESDMLNTEQHGRGPLGRTENIVGKGENAGYQHFLLFLQSFQKYTFSGLLKDVIV